VTFIHSANLRSLTLVTQQKRLAEMVSLALRAGASPCTGPSSHARAEGRDASRGLTFEFIAWSSFLKTESVFESDMRDLDPVQYTEQDRREVDPPLKVDSATWVAGGTLDWWVKERLEWFGRVRGKDGRQRWIKAADLRPAKSE
jgi:hypothetical protein